MRGLAHVLLLAVLAGAFDHTTTPVAPTLVVTYDRRETHQAIATVDSGNGAPDIGNGTSSKIVFVIRGSKVAEWKGVSPVPSDTCVSSTSTQDAEVVIVRCDVATFPSVFQFQEDVVTSAYSIMVGYRYEGPHHGQEFACGSTDRTAVCQNEYPVVERLEGCFRNGASTFGCNPLRNQTLAAVISNVGTDGATIEIKRSLNDIGAGGACSITSNFQDYTAETYASSYSLKSVTCDTTNGFNPVALPYELPMFEMVMRHTGTDSTGAVVEGGSARLHFAPAIISAYTNDTYDDVLIDGVVHKGSGSCVVTQSGNPDNSSYPLVLVTCERPENILVTLQGWGLSQLCKDGIVDTCTPKIEMFGGEHAYLPVARFHNMTDTELKFLLTSMYNVGESGELRVDVLSQDAGGMRTASVVNLAITHPPTLLRWNCSSSNTLMTGCEVPGNFTLWGDGFFPNGAGGKIATFEFVPVAMGNVTRPSTRLPCTLHYETPFKYTCVVDTHLREDLGFTAPVYTTEISQAGSWAYSMSFASGSKTVGNLTQLAYLWSPPVIDRVDGCRRTGSGATTENCVGTETLTITGRRFVERAVVNLNLVPCETTTYVDEYTLLCAVKYVRRATPVVQNVTVSVDQTTYNSTHTVMFDTSPVVLAIHGCVDTADGGTSVCPSSAGTNATSDPVLSIVGRGFYGAGSVRIWFGDYPCTRVRVVNENLVTCRVWNVSQHNPSLSLPVIVQRGVSEPAYTAQDIRIHFAPRPYITSASGCADGVAPLLGTFNCSPSALNTPVIIKGGNFQYFFRSVAVSFGGYPCEDVEVTDDSTIVCRAYRQLRGVKHVHVRVGNETTPLSNTTLHSIVSVGVACPVVNGEVCNGEGHCDVATGWCICNHDGWNRSVGCGDCVQYTWGDRCQHHCSCNYTFGGICDDGVAGTGLCKDCHEGYFGPTCERCPAPSASEPVCSGSGTCDSGVSGTGVCTCNPAGDFWAADCSDCQERYWGANCSIPCKGGGDCSGHGTCDPNPKLPGYRLLMLRYTRSGHNGQCHCDPEWAGDDCAQTCPIGEGGAVCHGHGTCASAVCTCSDTDAGHYAGAGCDECAAGWSGDDCTTACPVGTNNQTCSGNGACTYGECRCAVGYCGATCASLQVQCDVETCPTPFSYGASCQFVCPGTDIDAATVCSGNGKCDAGTLGSGLCSCKSPWRGAACDIDCSRCVGGTCTTTGQCVCDYGYSGTWCDKACPQANGEWCAGRGTCDWGTRGSGACTCKAGYAGLSCDTPCAGGADTPCNSHGACRAVDGGCDCFQEGRLGVQGRGSWMGLACDVCRPPYLAPHCYTTCPGLLADEKTVCSGHGECDGGSATCHCTRLDDAGFWDGAACDACAPGYYGDECILTCPGGSCHPCSGHGVCDDGRDGSGLCKCDTDPAAGMWSAADCSACGGGWFGVDCNQACPGVAEGLACSGHGTCDDGRTGTGTCRCIDDTLGGGGSHYTGRDCSVCAAGYYGATCSLECPRSADGLPCGGNGRCDDGVMGSGFCTCNEGWTGDACTAACPTTSGGVCHGRGSCLLAADNTAVCVCNTGRFTAASHCQACEPGWYGPVCEDRCPGANNIACNGRSPGGMGTCDAVTGVCNCLRGWGGVACEQRCPGPAGSPCGGHGTCFTDAAANYTVACACAESPATGYWTGAACDTCHPDYTGSRCDLPCPAFGGAVCGGRGACYPPAEAGATAGVCACNAGYCGPACELDGRETCQRYDCPTGYGSPTCAVRCPDCVAGQGVCDSGTLGSGMCLCAKGYSGDDCSVAVDCTPCVNGWCDATLDTDGRPSCACTEGWAGRWCDVECGGGWRDPCSGRGACSSGNAGDGTCACFDGWRGSDCNLACPVNPAYPADPVCSGHGVCIQSDLATSSPCTCEYRWAGALCDICEDGWSGNDCTTPCVHGATDGHVCACEFGWLGDGCVKSCPGNLVVADPTAASGQRTIHTCSGHGACDSTTHNCTCDPLYYGDDCSSYCYEPVTCAGYLQKAVQCTANGCRCAASTEQGYWQGTACDVCADGYYGENCLMECSCSGKAYRCEQHTGTCACWADSVNGFWKQPDCEVCEDGYTGLDCTEKETSYARVGGTQAIFSPKFENLNTSFILLDERERRVIIAATPPAVYGYGAVSAVEASNANASVGDASQAADALAGLAYDKPLSANLAGWSGRILFMEFSPTGEYIYAVNRIDDANHELLKVLRTGLIILHSFPIDPLGSTLSRRRQQHLDRANTPNTTAAHVGPAADARRASTLQTQEHVASVILGSMLYTVYYPEPGRATLHVTEIRDSGGSLKLLQIYALDEYAARVADVITWTSALRQNYLLISGVDAAGANVFITARLTDGGAQVEFQRVPIDLGRHSEKTLQLAATFSTQYWFSTLKYKGAVDGLWHLQLVRVDVSRATRSSDARGGSSATVTSEVRDVYSSIREFTAQRIAITQSPAAGQLVVRQAAEAPEPSLLFSFDPEGLAVTRNLKFGYFAGAAEDVVDIISIPALKLSVALPSAPFLRLVELNTFAVTDVEPKIIDISGNVTVVVTGTGFAAGDAYCKFLTTIIPAYKVNATNLWCDIPKLETVYTEGTCGGHPIEVSFYGRDRFTSNGVELVLVSSATVVSMSPSYGLLKDIVNVDAQLFQFGGYGFIDSSSTTCKLRNHALNAEVAGKAYLQNATHALCEVKLKPGALRVSRDPWVPIVSQNGAFYPDTQSGFGYIVVGEAAGLVVAADAQTVSMDSAYKTPLPTLQVYTVDEAGNRLLNFDGFERADLLITVDPDVVCTNTSDSVTYPLYRDGGAVFANLTMRGSFIAVDGLYLKQVTGGDCVVRISGVPSAAPGSVAWRAAFTVTVTTGRLAVLKIVSPLQRTVDDLRVPAGVIPYNHPEMVGPVVVRGQDAGGNFVPLARRDVLEVSIMEGPTGSRSNKTVHTVLVSPGLSGVEWIVVIYLQKQQIVYGTTYHLRLRPLQVRSGVAAVEDGPLVKRPCGEDLGESNPEYAVLGTADCRACPLGGECDGSHRVRVLSGWWREPAVVYTEDSYSARAEEVYTNIIRCPNPDACSGGLRANCTAGYEGLLCQACSDGYARQGEDCVPCFDSAVATQVVVIFVILFCMLVVAAVTYRVLSESALGRRNVVFVFIKLLVNYFQMLAAVVGDENVQWPSAIRILLSAQRKILNLHLSFAPFGCAAPLDVYEIFVIMIFVPFMWACFLLTVFPVLKGVAACIRRRKQKRQAADAVEAAVDGEPDVEIDELGISVRASPAHQAAPSPKATAPSPKAKVAALVGAAKQQQQQQQQQQQALPRNSAGSGSLPTPTMPPVAAGGARPASGASGNSGWGFAAGFRAFGDDSMSPQGPGSRPCTPPVRPDGSGQQVELLNLSPGLAHSGRPQSTTHLSATCEHSTGDAACIPMISLEDPLGGSLRTVDTQQSGDSRNSLPQPNTDAFKEPRRRPDSPARTLPEGARSSSVGAPISRQATADSGVGSAAGSVSPVTRPTPTRRMVSFMGAADDTRRHVLQEVESQESATPPQSMVEETANTVTEGYSSGEEQRERARQAQRRASQRATKSSIRKLSKMRDVNGGGSGDGAAPSASFVGLPELERDSSRRGTGGFGRGTGRLGGFSRPRKSTRVAGRPESGAARARRLSSVATAKLGVGSTMRRSISAAGHVELVIDSDSDSEGIDDIMREDTPQSPTLGQGTTDWIRAHGGAEANAAAPLGQPKSKRFAGQFQKVVHQRQSIHSMAARSLSATFVPGGRFVIGDFISTLAGTACRDVEVRCDPAPEYMVRLIPENPTLSFAPRALVFTPEKPVAYITVFSEMPGKFAIKWAPSGLGKVNYVVPRDSTIEFDDTIKISVHDMILTAWFVVFYLFHPLMVLFSGNLVDCVEVNGREYLVIDVSKECGTDEWWKWQYVNAAAIAFYGIVVPLLIIWYIRRELSRAGTRTVHALSFFISGYRVDCWFWDFVIMIRKCALIAIMVFEKKLLYRLFMAQVVVLMSILLNLYVRPLARAPHHHAETTSLFAVFAIVNLGLYYFRDDTLLQQSEMDRVRSSPMLAAVFVALILCNIVVFFAFVVLYVYLYKHRLVEEGRHGVIEWVHMAQDRDLRNLTLWETTQIIFYRMFNLKIKGEKGRGKTLWQQRKQQLLVKRRAKRVARLRRQILGKTQVEMDEAAGRESDDDGFDDVGRPPVELDFSESSEEEYIDPNAPKEQLASAPISNMMDMFGEVAGGEDDVAAPAPALADPNDVVAFDAPSPAVARELLAGDAPRPTLAEQLERPQPGASAARPQPQQQPPGAGDDAGVDVSIEEGKATRALREELHQGWRKAYAQIMREKWKESDQARGLKLSFERAVALGLTQDPEDPSIDFDVFLAAWMKQRREQEGKVGIGMSLGALGKGANKGPAPIPGAL